MKKIAKEIVDQINAGTRESSNLMELLSADFQLLLQNTIPKFQFPKPALEVGITKKYKIIAEHLNAQFGFEIFDKLKNHKSDILKGLASYLLAEQNITFKEKLYLSKLLANDSNAGVREWAWIAIRNDFALNLEDNIKLIIPWTKNNKENIRRFASELSRPRGVWCAHITKFRENPTLGLQILEPLKSDPAKYVQLSVGNWLNDAGKDHPEWVKDLCAQWKNESATKETEKICKRALRNLKA
jgi:3-methyladenine DNA glycosylase AlkC